MRTSSGKNKLQDFDIDGKNTDDEYLKRTQMCDSEADVLKQEQAELTEQLNSKDEFQKHMESVRAVMRAAQRDVNRGHVSKDFIEKYIDKIYVTPMEDGCVKLEIKIFTGDATEKFLSKLRKRADDVIRTTHEDEKNLEIAMVSGDEGRSGHTFKNLTPERTFSLTRKMRLKNQDRAEICYIFGFVG